MYATAADTYLSKIIFKPTDRTSCNTESYKLFCLHFVNKLCFSFKFLTHKKDLVRFFINYERKGNIQFCIYIWSLISCRILN